MESKHPRDGNILSEESTSSAPNLYRAHPPEERRYRKARSRYRPPSKMAAATRHGRSNEPSSNSGQMEDPSSNSGYPYCDNVSIIPRSDRTIGSQYPSAAIQPWLLGAPFYVHRKQDGVEKGIREDVSEPSIEQLNPESEDRSVDVIWHNTSRRCVDNVNMAPKTGDQYMNVLRNPQNANPEWANNMNMAPDTGNQHMDVQRSGRNVIRPGKIQPSPCENRAYYERGCQLDASRSQYTPSPSLHTPVSELSSSFAQISPRGSSQSNLENQYAIAMSPPVTLLALYECTPMSTTRRNIGVISTSPRPVLVFGNMSPPPSGP